jgi:hypothetical protein
LDRENEILLHEPERISAQASLSAEAKMHRDLHLLLEKAGREPKNRAPALSADFNDTLLARLDQAIKNPSALPPLNDADFLPVASAGDAGEGFLRSRTLWQASAAVLVAVGIGIGSFQYVQRAEIPSANAKTSEESATERALTEEQRLGGPAGLTESDVKPGAVSPDATAPGVSVPETPEALAAPSPEAVRHRDMWDEETADPEADLKARIQAERNPARRKELQKQLLQIYESTGQTEKAAALRAQIQ